MSEKDRKKTADIINKQTQGTPKGDVQAGRSQSESQRNTGFIARLSGRLNETMQSNRGGGGGAAPVVAAPTQVQRPVQDIAPTRVRTNKGQQKMFIPEGVVINGSLSGASEAEIHGRIEGDINVKATLFLGKSATVTGNVKAATCQVEGLIQGEIICTEDLIVSSTGRLESSAEAGKQVRIAGNVTGNINTPGTLRIEAGGVINGDVQARVFSMSEGAELNGRCSMRSAADQQGLSAPKEDKGQSK
ncbi:MAG: polymer-forming cytoskeletal protein [Candidatus Hydrogenedentes bacterium]|jgi:cytoskeletal protein CcmA (bactofilin family)|nr:polymer-forming cytoskeletal protein [Candidatus Hydrogenedentota bacterium]